MLFCRESNIISYTTYSQIHNNYSCNTLSECFTKTNILSLPGVTTIVVIKRFLFGIFFEIVIPVCLYVSPSVFSSLLLN